MDPMKEKLGAFLHMDLAEFTWAGKCLLLATVGFFFGCAFLIGFGVDQYFAASERRAWVKILAFAGLVGSVAFYQAGKLLLRAFGFPVYREPQPPRDDCMVEGGAGQDL